MDIDEMSMENDTEAAIKKNTKFKNLLKKASGKISASSPEFQDAYKKFLKDVMVDGGIMEISELEKFLENFDYSLDDLDRIMDILRKTDITIKLPDEELESEDDDTIDLENEDDKAKDAAISYGGDADTADSIRMYLREIGKVPLLTQDEEVELAKQIYAGNEANAKVTGLIDAQKEKGEEINSAKELAASLPILEKAKQKLDAKLVDIDRVIRKLNKQHSEGELSDAGERELNDAKEKFLMYHDKLEQVENTIDDAEDAEYKISVLTKELDTITSELAAVQADEELKKIISIGEVARKRMAEANLRLVVSCAKRYIGRGMTFLDLIQEGNLGLLRAIDKFDYSRGFKFSTYATWWIKQGISRALADQSRNIRIPVHMVESINKLLRATRRLTNDLHREPTTQEIAAELDVTVSKVEEMRQLARDTVSLDTPIGDEEDTALSDFIEDDRALSPESMTYQKGLRDDLQDVMQELTWREREVITMRYGLDGKGERTLEAIGEMFDVTRERIRQIEAKAMKKLKHPTRSRKLRDYLN